MPFTVDLRGVLNDVLAVSEDSVYMRHLKVDFETGDDLRFGEPSLHHNIWSRQVPIFARALVLAGDTLFLAGPPEHAELRPRELTLPNPDEAEATFQGRQGAALCLVNAADGDLLAQYELEASPVFDAMIAARGRIFLSLEDGSVVCFGQ